jgi:sulfite reductase alpha subunit-like flavoprotein
VILHDGRAEQLDRLWRNWARWQNPQVRHLSKLNYHIFDLVDSAYEGAEASTRPKAKQLVNAGPTEVRIYKQYAAPALRQDQR